MSQHDHALIDVLLRLRDDAPTPLDSPNRSDLVKAAIMVLCSASVETMPLVELLGWDTLTDEHTGTPIDTSGLSVSSVPCHVFDVIDALASIGSVPPEVQSAVGPISLDELRAALLATRCILYALQRNRYPMSESQTVTDEDRDRVLARNLRQLHHFRETGEP